MKYLAIIAVLLITIGCSTNVNVDRTWVDKDIHSKKLTGVLVVAVAENLKLRKLFEDDYVTELKKQGVNAHASHELGLEQINPDNVVGIAQKRNLESVLVTNYIGSSEYNVYNGDTFYYGGAMMISSDGNSHSYYGYSYQVNGPAYHYTTHKFVSLVSSLYEVSTRKMLWNTVSSAELAGDPRNLFVPFIRSFVGQAKKENLIN